MVLVYEVAGLLVRGDEGLDLAEQGFVAPLVPALQTVWMTIHVPVIMTGYAMGMLLMVLGHVYLIRGLFNRLPPEGERTLDSVMYRVLQLTALFLLVGVIYERTHETVHLGLREGSEVVYVAKMGGHKQAKAPSRLGGRMPLHATAIGKALLAHAPDDVQTEVLSRPLKRFSPRTITAPGLLRQQLDQRLAWLRIGFD